MRRALEGTKPADESTQAASPPSAAASKLDPYRQRVQERVALGLTVVRILRELQEDGYTGGRTILGRRREDPRPPRSQALDHLRRGGAGGGHLSAGEARPPGQEHSLPSQSEEALRLDLVPEPRPNDYDTRCDGIFPLITNCKESTPLAVLEVYRSKQPHVEKRHHLLKNVQSATPVQLKSVSRIEALLFLFFVAMLAVALVERETRKGMERLGLENLPLYPEERLCSAPSASRIFEILAPLQRHVLRREDVFVQRFEPELTKLQRQILTLVRLSPQAFSGL